MFDSKINGDVLHKPQGEIMLITRDPNYNDKCSTSLNLRNLVYAGVHKHIKVDAVLDCSNQYKLTRKLIFGGRWVLSRTVMNAGLPGWIEASPIISRFSSSSSCFAALE